MDSSSNWNYPTITYYIVQPLKVVDDIISGFDGEKGVESMFFRDKRRCAVESKRGGRGVSEKNSPTNEIEIEI